MNIGILTFHQYDNYGAVLQAYAMMKTLHKIGHQCEIIDLRRRPRNRFVSDVYERVFNRNFYLFREEYLNPRTGVYYADDDLCVLNKEFDCFLVGSDQVWRPELTQERVLRYFLDFADENVLKISYAASFGTSTWRGDPELTENVSSLLRGFDAISVREKSGVSICRDIFGVDATHVLDPALLLTESEYAVPLKDIYMELPQHYGVSFFMDSDSDVFESVITELLHSLRGIPVVSLSVPQIRFRGKAYHFGPRPVMDWLYALRHSEIIVTESFHCVAIAVVFGKKFICVVNRRRGKARLDSFLSMLGLSDFLVERDQCTKERFSSLLSKEIDWSNVISVLRANRERSVEFLHRVLAHG
ncbi:MAG: polysaccharide pyruvyl transferase family protein [Candidatus Krumholzibacteriota bacterium]|nr:polysaccharide pyruvyl transferase family protein [Candidatus Krumholzibacteriota bacterium]